MVSNREPPSTRPSSNSRPWASTKRIRRAHGALQVADAGLLAEWMLERPEERGHRGAAAVCIIEAASFGYPLGRRRIRSSEVVSAVAEFTHSGTTEARLEGRHRYRATLIRAEWRRRLVGLHPQGRGEGAASALRRRGRRLAAPLTPCLLHLRDVLDKIAWKKNNRCRP